MPLKDFKFVPNSLRYFRIWLNREVKNRVLIDAGFVDLFFTANIL